VQATNAGRMNSLNSGFPSSASYQCGEGLLALRRHRIEQMRKGQAGSWRRTCRHPCLGSNRWRKNVEPLNVEPLNVAFVGRWLTQILSRVGLLVDQAEVTSATRAMSKDSEGSGILGPCLFGSVMRSGIDPHGHWADLSPWAVTQFRLLSYRNGATWAAKCLLLTIAICESCAAITLLCHFATLKLVRFRFKLTKDDHARNIFNHCDDPCRQHPY